MSKELRVEGSKQLLKLHLQLIYSSRHWNGEINKKELSSILKHINPELAISLIDILMDNYEHDYAYTYPEITIPIVIKIFDVNGEIKKAFFDKFYYELERNQGLNIYYVKKVVMALFYGENENIILLMKSPKPNLLDMLFKIIELDRVMCSYFSSLPAAKRLLSKFKEEHFYKMYYEVLNRNIKWLFKENGKAIINVLLEEGDSHRLSVINEKNLLARANINEIKLLFENFKNDSNGKELEFTLFGK